MGENSAGIAGKEQCSSVRPFAVLRFAIKRAGVPEDINRLSVTAILLALGEFSQHRNVDITFIKIICPHALKFYDLSIAFELFEFQSLELNGLRSASLPSCIVLCAPTVCPVIGLDLDDGDFSRVAANLQRMQFALWVRASEVLQETAILVN